MLDQTGKISPPTSRPVTAVSNISYLQKRTHSTIFFLLVTLVYACCTLLRMSAIPFGTFSAYSVHEIIRAERKQKQQEESKRGTLLSEMADDAAPKPKLGEKYNYNLKFMKSVWGMYNQYAPQAFQKNEELLAMKF